MDSDAEGVPSEFFDYFKVSIASLQMQNLFIHSFWYFIFSLYLGFVHSRFSDMP